MCEVRPVAATRANGLGFDIVAHCKFEEERLRVVGYVQVVVQGLEVVVVAARKGAHGQIHAGRSILGGSIGEGDGGGVEGERFSLELLLSVEAPERVGMGVRRPYRLEDPDGISLADVVEQQVRANKPSKARPYYCDSLARVLHDGTVVGVSCGKLSCCCLANHDVKSSFGLGCSAAVSEQALSVCNRQRATAWPRRLSSNRAKYIEVQMHAVGSRIQS